MKKIILLMFFSLTSLLIKPQSPAINADLLIRNTTLVDVVNNQLLFNRNLAVKNGQILTITDTLATFDAKQIIDGSRLITLPGFVNTHTHLWQHICKSCYPKGSLQNWVKIYNTIHYLDSDQIYNIVIAASSEALLSGITTVSDYASLSFNDYALEANANAMRDAGLKGVLVYNNPSVFLPDSIKIKEIKLLQQKYNDKFQLWMGYGPLSFFSIPQVFSGILIGNKLNMNFTEHTMENNKEQRDFYDSTKTYFNRYKEKLAPADRQFMENLLELKRPSNVDAFEQLLHSKDQLLKTDSILKLSGDTAYIPLNDQEKESLAGLKIYRTISPLMMLDYLNGLKNFLSIHSVWTMPEDIKMMAEKGITVSHNPESNLYLTSGIAPVNDYLNSGILVSLGTDGAASNDGINMFSAMREMWNVYKIKLMNVEISKHIDDWTILKSATINGAKALKIDHRTGSLEKGKEADMIMVSMDELGMSPIRSDKLISLLIYSGSSRNIKYVVSDGKILVDNGQLTRYDELLLARNLTRTAAEVDDAIKNGKTWSGSFILNAELLKDYWYHYRSIRLADSVNLTLTNYLPRPIKISIISSGAVFGGGTSTVVDKSVSNRFPYYNFNNSFKEQILMNPYEQIQLIKNKRKYIYQIKTSKGTITKKTGPGQLLVFAEKSN